MRHRRQRGPAAALLAIVASLAGATVVGGLGVWLGVLPAALHPDLVPPPPSAAPRVAVTAAPPAAALPTPRPTPGARPPAAETARAYLAAWEQARYPDMYRLLGARARRTIAEDRFIARYQAITVGAGILGLSAALGPAPEPDRAATAVALPFAVELRTGRLGVVREENTLPLVFEEDSWRVDWTPGLIFRDLTRDRTARLVPDDPVRGAILDRNGAPLAAQGAVLTVGAVPGRVKDRERVVAEVARYVGGDPAAIRRRIEAAQPDWWVPLGDFPAAKRAELTQRFAGLDGVLVEEMPTRVYRRARSPPTWSGTSRRCRSWGSIGGPVYEQPSARATARQRGPAEILRKPSGSAQRALRPLPYGPGAMGVRAC